MQKEREVSFLSEQTTPCQEKNGPPKQNAIKCTVKGKADDLYHGSMQFVNHCRTALQYPLVHWTLCRCQQCSAFSMKALARYQLPSYTAW